MKGISRTIRRRRAEGKTDYKSRLGLLKSGKPRVIVRKTNRYIIGQIIISDSAKDKTIVEASSKELLSKGWPENLKGSLKNLSAGYLTGFLLGKKSKEIKEGILDAGLQRNVPNSRIYAFVKGLADSGFKIPHNKDVLPSDELIERNEKTGKLIKRIKEGLGK